ncbi:MAG: response regulator [Candidatus Dormibacteraeota bacterium]|nr:response regulator [Candidatus Dormibacteraeota bacterium]
MTDKAPRQQVVLVVDDHPLNLELIEGCLADVDCRVITATDGIEALELVKKDRPDLVLLDVMMPRMDGYEVCQRLKDSPEGKLLPVVMVTALGQIADRVRGLEVGADDFIVKPIERVELVARVRSLLRVKQLYDRLDDAQRTIFSLARAVEAKDSSLEAHTERVGMNARRVGEALGLSEETLDDLLWGGVIHDIGKIGIPDSILLKPGPLTVEEFELMKQHVFIGEEIARPLRSAHDLLPIIRHHHERIDGTGYPDGLAGEAIPLGGRIVAICDAFDAMISDRPYRKGLTHANAMATLVAGAGTQWDSQLVSIFQTLVSEPLPERAPVVS